MTSTRASSSRIDRWLGIDGDSPGDMALIEQRLAVLQPRLPWLYAMMLSCQVGMVFTFEADTRTQAVALALRQSLIG